MNSSVVRFFDALASQLQRHLVQRYGEGITVSRRDDSEARPVGSLSWSWILSIDSTSTIIAAAPIDTWRELCDIAEDASAEDLQNEFRSWLTPAIIETARNRFGSEVTCHEEAGPESLPEEWCSVPLVIRLASGREVMIHASINPDLESALGAPDESESVMAPPPRRGADLSQVELLMGVEMPVTVSLGRTKLRLKELLEVTNGSILELDEDLSDEVEIRVNNQLIAYGEVVVVQGNYAVRILRMAPTKTPDVQGILPERAA